MQHPETDTGSPSPYQDKENGSMSMHVPLMIGTVMSHNPRIPTSKGNSVSYVQDDGSRNMSLALAD